MDFNLLTQYQNEINAKAEAQLTEPQFAQLLGFDKSTFSNWKKRPNGAPEYAVKSARAHSLLSKSQLKKLISNAE